MRLLFLDDSGKADPNDHSKVLVFAGFSIDEQAFHSFRRQVAGTKIKYFPDRHPDSWEIKSTDFLPRNNWHKKRNREVCFELVNILQRNSCSVFVASADKTKASNSLSEDWLVPLLVQKIVLKFHAEVLDNRTSGMVLCDWSSYRLDRHISNCVSSLVVTRGLSELRGGVMYGSSNANNTLQVSDMIAGCFRRNAEGQIHLLDLKCELATLRYFRPGRLDSESYPVDSIIQIF